MSKKCLVNLQNVWITKQCYDRDEFLFILSLLKSFNVMVFGIYRDGMIRINKGSLYGVILHHGTLIQTGITYKKIRS